MRLGFPLMDGHEIVDPVIPFPETPEAPESPESPRPGTVPFALQHMHVARPRRLLLLEAEGAEERAAPALQGEAAFKIAECRATGRAPERAYGVHRKVHVAPSERALHTVHMLRVFQSERLYVSTDSRRKLHSNGTLATRTVHHPVPRRVIVF